ncbi:MAG: NAD(P)/FAD-dependent oxidoreductase [Alphaproteobacteria bacterium]|nr:NAD(P)/FAD-dependent oxidoreductase [Alphaproteobacteria bacterium]
MSTAPLLDLLVVGGGPAGLSAALYAGRARRRVAVVDAGSPRHAVAEGVHNLIGLEGIAPAELRRRAWSDLAPFDVTHVEGRVEALKHDGRHWHADLGDRALVARAVLLATGVVDLLPDWPGLRATWGHSVHVCPFCHGWEMRDRALVAYGQGDHLAHFARMLRSWSADLVVLTGDTPLPAEDRADLEALGIVVRAGHPVALAHDGPALTKVHLDDGTLLARTGMFLGVHQRQTPLVRSLGLESVPDPFNEDGHVKTDDMGRTSLPMLWAAGDLCTRMQQVSQAIASGGGRGAMIHSILAMDP